MLSERLKSPPKKFKKFFIGLSGGKDSVVLLNLLIKKNKFNLDSTEEKQSIEAIHINHNLQPDSKKFELFCIDLCKKVNVNLHTLSINIYGEDKKKLGVEAAARKYRYKAFSSILKNKDDCLVLAHHMDDQLETVLLQWIRGAGLNGLTGMNFFSEKKIDEKKINIWRPMLEFSKEEISDFIIEKNLSWIDDPSNQNLNFDRNKIRSEVIPILQSIREGSKKNMNRTIEHLQNTRLVIEELLEENFNKCKCKNTKKDSESLLSKTELLKNSNIIIAFLLRIWLKKQECPMPPTSRLNEFIRQLKEAPYSKKVTLNVQNDSYNYSILVDEDEIKLLVN